MNKIKTLNRSGLSREILFNGNALDTSGNGGNGTATNVTYTTTNRSYQTQMASFNGSNSTVTLGTLTASTFSVSFLFTPTDTANQRTLFEMDNSSNTAMFSVLINSNQLRLNTYDGGTFNDRTLSGLSANITYNIAITVSGGTANFYLNGQFVGSHIVNNITYGGSNTSIGYKQRTSQFYYSGTLQTFRFNTSIISDEEIRNRYLEGLRYLGGQSYGSLFDGLVAYYDMNGDAIDVVGGNNGTVTGATLTADRFGIANRAYNFDGNSDYITTTLTSALGNSDYTFAMWVYFNNLGTDDTFLIKLTTGADYLVLSTEGTDPTKIDHVIAAGSISSRVTSTTGYVTTGQWYLLSFSRGNSGTLLNTYKNGENKVTANITARNMSNTAPIVFGRNNTTACIDGKIGEVFYFNRLLTDEEQKLLYQLSSTTYPYPF